MENKTQVFLISNTHWDREWYMPKEKYMIRLVKLMDRLIDVMEKDPQYRFITDGQYIMVEDYLSVRPEMRERIKKLMNEGRLKVGPWYTQPLETMVTGEGMVRNLYLGITETEKLGPPMLFAYMIDEFGHASQMPQILKGFGITDMMAWRGIENKAGDIFEWSAPGGDSVFMHRSVHGYGEAVAMPEDMDNFREVINGHTFNRQGLRERIKRIKSLKDGYARTDAQFWLNGVDHSWAQENIAGIIEMINSEFPEYNVRHSTLEEYSLYVRGEIESRKIPLQKYKGEMIHPDEQILVCAHSVRADQKQKHYHAERILEKRAEPMSALAWLLGYEYPLWALRESWKYILENHAHDSLDCCSVDEVYERVMSRYTSSVSLSEQLSADAFAFLMSMDPGGSGDGGRTIYVFNTNSVEYEGLVTGSFDMPDSLSLNGFDMVDRTTGNKAGFAVLRTETIKTVKYNAFYGHPDRIPGKRYTIALDAGKLSGFSVKSFSLREKDTQPDVRENLWQAPAENTLENEFYIVEIKPDGCIDVLDKCTGIKYSSLLQIADSGDRGNLWIHARPENNVVITNENAVASIKKLADNEFLTEYEIKYTLDIPAGYDFQSESRSTAACAMNVAVNIRLLKKTRYIGVEIELENSSRFHQVRVLFPSGIKGARTSLSGQPYDVVERRIGIPEGFDYNIDPNCEYHPMQDFCAVTDGTGGLMVAAKGIYEYEAINDDRKTLALTLLRSVRFDLDGDDSAAGYNMEKSYLFTKIRYGLAVIPFAGDWRNAYPHMLNFINVPYLSFKCDPDEAVLPGYTKPALTLPPGMEFIKTGGENVYVTAVKREENGGDLLIRLVSFAKASQNISVGINGMIHCKGSWKYSLKEVRGERISEGNTANFDIMPGQIVTIGFEVCGRSHGT